MPCASAASTQTLAIYEEVVQRILFLRRIESLLTEAGFMRAIKQIYRWIRAGGVPASQEDGRDRSCGTI